MNRWLVSRASAGAVWLAMRDRFTGRECAMTNPFVEQTRDEFGGGESGDLMVDDVTEDDLMSRTTDLVRPELPAGARPPRSTPVPQPQPVAAEPTSGTVSPTEICCPYCG